MAEGRMPEIVPKRNSLAQVFIQPQSSGHRARELRNFEGMREPGSKQVPFVVQEDLRLVDHAAKGRAVHDAVTVALKIIAPWVWLKRVASAATRIAITRTGPEQPELGRFRARQRERILRSARSLCRAIR